GRCWWTASSRAPAPAWWPGPGRGSPGSAWAPRKRRRPPARRRRDSDTAFGSWGCGSWQLQLLRRAGIVEGVGRWGGELLVQRGAGWHLLEVVDEQSPGAGLARQEVRRAAGEGGGAVRRGDGLVARPQLVHPFIRERPVQLRDAPGGLHGA